MITLTCPECKHQLELDSTPEIGKVLQCSNCEEVFEVTWLFPINLDYKENPGRISPQFDESNK
jgi:uncharacterized protein YbaR (Trm112 family)